LRPSHPEQLQGCLIELRVRSLGGDRVGEVLELVDELEEAVCVSFHVITFGRATDGKLGRGQERLFAPSAMVYTLKAHGRKAGKPSDGATAWADGVIGVGTCGGSRVLRE
jgi:hypothetical protein